MSTQTLSFTIATVDKDNHDCWHTSVKIGDMDQAITKALEWAANSSLDSLGIEVIMIAHSGLIDHSIEVDFRRAAERRAAARERAVQANRAAFFAAQGLTEIK